MGEPQEGMDWHIRGVSACLEPAYYQPQMVDHIEQAATDIEQTPRHTYGRSRMTDYVSLQSAEFSPCPLFFISFLFAVISEKEVSPYIFRDHLDIFRGTINHGHATSSQFLQTSQVAFHHGPQFSRKQC
jgi:hypothetical protein